MRSKIQSIGRKQFEIGLPILAVFLLLGGTIAVRIRTVRATGVSAQERLEAGKPIEREIAAGATQSFALRLQAKEFIHVFIFQRGVNIAATLVAPDGKKLVEADTPLSTQEAEWLTYVAAAAGDYEIRVRAVDNGSPPGRFEIWLEEQRQSAPTDEARLTAQSLLAEAKILYEEDKTESYRKAIEKYKQAVALYAQAGRRTEEAVTLTSAARALAYISENLAAMEHFNKALLIYRERKDVHGEGTALNGIGFVLYYLNRYEEAIRYYKEALEARRRVGYRAGEGQTFTNLGFAYQSLNRFDEAIQYNEQALAIWRELKNQANEASTLGQLGYSYFKAKQNEKAVRCYEQALVIHRQLKNRSGEASTLSDLGFTYWMANEYEKSIGWDEQALAMYRELKDRAAEARVLTRLGLAYRKTNRKEMAIRSYEQALAIHRELKDRAGEASMLNDLGFTYSMANEYEKAISWYEQALALRRELKDRKGEASTLNALGLACWTANEHARAADWYGQALAIQRELKDQEGEAKTLVRLGLIHSSMGESEKAHVDYEQALTIQRQLKDREGEASTLINLGNVSDKVQRYERAIGYYEQALAIRRETRDRKGEVTVLHSLGYDYYNRKQYEQALSYYEQALAIRRDLKDREGEAVSLNSFGMVYGDLNDYTKAISFHEQALAIARDVKDRSSQVYALSSLGRVSQQQGQPEKALGYYEQALALRRELKDTAGEGTDLNALGMLHIQLSHYDKAFGYFNQALAVAREAKNRKNESTALITLGFAYELLGQYETAIRYFEQALAIARELKDRKSEATGLYTMGMAYLQMRQPDKAISCFEQAQVAAREVKNNDLIAEALNGLGLVYSSLNQAEKAVAYFDLALVAGRERKSLAGNVSALLNLGMVNYLLKKYDKASGYIEQALQATRELKSRDMEAAALSMVMILRAERGQPRAAIVVGKQSINLLQEIRTALRDLDPTLRQSFVQAKKSTYRYLADLLAGQGRLAEAQQVLDMLKEDEFVKFVQRDLNIAAGGSRATLTAEEAEWEKRYLEVAERLTALGVRRGALLAKADRTADDEKELARLESDLEAGSRAFQTFLNGVEAALGVSKSAADQVARVREAEGLMETLRDLGPGTVAVYTIMGEQGYRSILITPDVQKGYAHAIPAAELNKKILAFREVVRNPAFDPRPLARELYDILVKPMAKDLEGAQAQTVMWSLDGALRYLPVAALYDGEKYLVERFRNVVFTPASQSRLKDPVSRDWRGLGLGVSLAHQGFQALPNVPTELHAIIQFGSQAAQGVLPGTVKLDADFTKEGFRAELRKRYSIIHLASHFNFAPGTDRNSYLLLGDGGKLTLEEFRGFPQMLQGVELLTLSACDTAVGGEDADGKEVEGFAVLAQRQGAKAVIATLWAVADESTALLMKEFYRLRMSDTTMTKAEALRQAQLALLTGKIRGDATADRGPRTNQNDKAPKFVSDPQRPYAHPFFWAPFLLMGNWK